jgi:AcrR family transcriptional regulator
MNPSTDGRRARREQNREAVLDALGAFFDEGVYTPSTAEIAERAGLSPRSLFRYFDDVDDLNRAAIERQVRRAAPLLDPGIRADDHASEKIRRVVVARVRLFEEIAAPARAARVCAPGHPIITEQVTGARSYLRHQLQRAFAPELAALGDRGAAVLSSIDVLLSFESYDLLRADQQLSKARTIAVLVDALTALLSPQSVPTPQTTPTKEGSSR